MTTRWSSGRSEAAARTTTDAAGSARARGRRDRRADRSRGDGAVPAEGGGGRRGRDGGARGHHRGSDERVADAYERSRQRRRADSPTRRGGVRPAPISRWRDIRSEASSRLFRVHAGIRKRCHSSWLSSVPRSPRPFARTRSSDRSRHVSFDGIHVDAHVALIAAGSVGYPRLPPSPSPRLTSAGAPFRRIHPSPPRFHPGSSPSNRTSPPNAFVRESEQTHRGFIIIVRLSR